MTTRIFPRNLTARAAVQIVGNPVTSRLESGVGNCFPGLEFDHRNLDRRFFPELIINFGVLPPILASVDRSDPALAASAPDGVANHHDGELSPPMMKGACGGVSGRVPVRETSSEAAVLSLAYFLTPFTVTYQGP
jgi:hypothetical protein